MEYIQYHVYDGGTAITNFEKRMSHIYEAAIDLYGSEALSIGPPMSPLCGYCDYNALHIDLKKHPSHLDEFWAIFSSIAYNLIETDWMVKYSDHKVFNKYQMDRAGLNRIN